jgi:7-carboxy-7-deazaguanine synthase
MVACRFCDATSRGTDGFGCDLFDRHTDVVEHIRTTRAAEAQVDRPCVVIEGGDSPLPLDELLVAASEALGLGVAIETDGSRPVPAGGVWASPSPKPRPNLVVRMGNEPKLIFPQLEISLEDLESLGFDHFFLQPMAGPER